jgi:hypothetical protein
MRKIIYLAVLTLLFISCSGGGSDNPTSVPEPANTAPTFPTLVAPANSLLCTINFGEVHPFLVFAERVDRVLL